jgi:fermentation-respiration switch protein FrsA (DUF1100 family)
VRRTLATVAAAGVLALVLIMLLEERFIYFPAGYDPESYARGESAGAADVWFSASDGVRLHAWLFQSDSAAATILMAHGNAGNLSHRLPVCLALRGAGFNVLIFDYRGYGRSEGDPSEEGIYLDAAAAFDQAARMLPGTAIVIHGSSLGGAVAVETAVRKPAAGLILEATFTSAADVGAIHYPFLPVRIMMRTGLNSIGKIRAVRAPKLFIHGDADEIIPIDLGRKLFEAAPEPKEFVTIPQAGHNDLFSIGGGEYLRAVGTFTRAAAARWASGASNDTGGEDRTRSVTP